MKTIIFTCLVLTACAVAAAQDPRVKSIEKKHAQSDQVAAVAYWKAKLASDKQYAASLQALMDSANPSEGISGIKSQADQLVADDIAAIAAKAPVAASSGSDAPPDKSDGKIMRDMTEDQVTAAVKARAYNKGNVFKVLNTDSDLDGGKIVSYVIQTNGKVGPQRTVARIVVTFNPAGHVVELSDDAQ